MTFNALTTGGLAVSIREWTAVDPNAGSFTGTSREVMRIAGYTTGHSNGAIAFNPTAKPGDADYGNLYIGSGDGEYWDPSANAQNGELPQGKILRINPLQGPHGEAYTIPSDNPYVNVAGQLPEIWASGLRNPQSFTWDGQTGKMYINDIGQNLFEEVDIGKSGANYGWPYREGYFAKDLAFGGPASDESAYALPANDARFGYTYPKCGYSHSEGYSLGSGILYRGAGIPELDGKYVMTDIVNGRLFYCDPAQAGDGLAAMSEIQVEQDGTDINLQQTFGYDSWLASPRVDARLSTGANGEWLLLMKSDGGVYQLTEATSAPEPASLLLLAPALAGLGWVRRLRRKRAG